MTTLEATRPDSEHRGQAAAWFRRGVTLAVLLLVAAGGVAQLPGVDVNAGAVAPLMASWDPRVGPGTLPALALVVVAASLRLPHLLRTATWGRLLAAAWATGLAWLLSLALVDGRRGVGAVLDDPTEYLRTARSVQDVGALLRGFSEHIPLDSPDHWPVHVAGHPPGALLVFVGLDRLGLGSPLAAGLVVCVVAATTPVAVAVTARALGAERAVRVALPFLVLGPSAVWQAVSADAVFAAVAAWTVAAAALATTTRPTRRRVVLATVAGLLLTGCALLSYGLPLIALVVAAAVVAGGSSRSQVAATLAVVAGVALAGLLATAVTGFRYWEAYPVLQQRYWDGLASARPGAYWVWANLAVLAVSAGPVVAGALAVGLPRVVRSLRTSRTAALDPVAALVCAAVVAVLVADLSLMSKAEVERIWLFLVPWLALATTWLPEGWRRRALVAQAAVALLLQHLLSTFW